MADKLKDFSTSKYSRDQIGIVVDDIVTMYKSSRRVHERRWYDNNFFDDGFHFRYLSRQQNKIVDISSNANIYNPLRAIPIASRQIRGIANLLASQDPIPIAYPEKVNKANYPAVEGVDPATGQPIQQENPEYQQAMQLAKEIAKKSGHWLKEEFKKQELIEKLALMLILTQKHSISLLKIWPDAIEEKIKTAVRDAFDTYFDGSLNELEDCPIIVETSKVTVAQLKANEMFDEGQKQKISPDNRHASSEIKEAYMNQRYGRDTGNDQAVSLILKEAFIKEYLDEKNEARIRTQQDADKILRKRKKDDIVIRQVFSAGGIWLRDKYVHLTSYPLVDYRMEPGPLYSVPQIERFIPQNKSYDMLVSRGERITHASTTGILLRQQGQQFNISNEAGAQVVDYNGVPPQWLGMPNLPNSFFNMLGIIKQNIDEQGVTLSTTGKLPSGVKGYQAIESLKESEYSNLVISNRRFRQTVKRIAEKFLDIADDYFVSPQTVYLLEKGEPQYFDVVGNAAFEQGKKLKEENPYADRDIIPLKKECYVDIEVESQLGYTQEGRKAAAKELADLMIQMLQLPVPALPPEAVAIFFQQLLKAYQFGPTEEMMEAIENYIQDGGAAGVGQDTLDTMKLGMLEVIKDLQGSPTMPTPEQRIDEGKVAVAEVAKDLQGSKNANTV